MKEKILIAAAVLAIGVGGALYLKKTDAAHSGTEKSSVAHGETVNESISNTSNSDFAVLEVMRALSESLATQQLQKELEAKSGEYQKEFAAQEQKFRSENEQLIANPQSLSQSELQKKQKALQNKFENFQETVDLRRRQLEFAYRHSMSEIHEKINEIVKQLAVKKNLKYVLRDAAVAWTKDLEMTKFTSEVIEILNQESPTIVVKFPTKEELLKASGTDALHLNPAMGQ